MPAINFIRVDLPQPDGPTMLTNSPSANAKLVGANAVILSSRRVVYVLLRSTTSSNGGAGLLGWVVPRSSAALAIANDDGSSWNVDRLGTLLIDRPR